MKPKVLNLSDERLSSLRAFLRATRDAGEYKRGLAILLKAEGRSSKDISLRLSASRRSVCEWMRRYKLQGLEGLKSRPIPKKKSRLSEEEKGLIVETALKDPKLFGYLRNDWSVRLLSYHLTRRLGIRVSKSHVWRMLREAGIVYKRPKRVVKSPDPDYEEKAETVKELKRASSELSKKGRC